MKSTTQLHIAIRNIGDSQNQGTSFNGSLSESILWLATQLSQITMAGRIVVGLGRSEEDALRGIQVKGAGKQVVGEDMKAMLDSIFAGDNQVEADEALAEDFGLRAARVAGDDYES